jgi:hypothetical protein
MDRKGGNPFGCVTCNDCLACYNSKYSAVSHSVRHPITKTETKKAKWRAFKQRWIKRLPFLSKLIRIR